MHILIIVISITLSAVSAFAAEAPENYREETKRLIDSKEYLKAEKLLNKLLSDQPTSADYHQLLGDVLRREGKLEEAIGEYEKARALGKDNTELLKGIASTYKRMMLYKNAVAFYKKALELSPDDKEAADDLNNLRLDRGIQLKAWAGGFEVDYTVESYVTALFYGGLNKTDLYAGYGHVDEIYYDKDKIYAKGYYFYNPDSYVKLLLRKEEYIYPVDPLLQKPNPDSSAYYKVPGVEIEASHLFTKSLKGALIYELNMPNFFYDRDSSAVTQKASAEIYYITPLDFLRLKLIYSILRDPDPDKTEIKGRDNHMTPMGVATATDVRYHISSLFGGSVEFAYGKWSAELKYLPNRELDHSYKYSIYTKIGYELTQDLSLQFDHLYDKYSSISNYAGQTANVYMLSGLYKLNKKIEVGAGYKHVDIPVKRQSTGFLSLNFKTGLGL